MSDTHLPHDHGEETEALLKGMPEAGQFQALAEVFRQLSDGSRLRLFWLLCHCEQCVTNLSSIMGMSSPAISHHLRQLREARLITSRRDGKEVYYKAVDTPAARTLHDALEALMAITCPMEQ
ncbi:MAG: winged helix-turn-helix transcriptional regulator [Firmicutes bacterium]|nr:winged helix-turn-helix transcriptional regulator [Bacillota bacterium]